MTTGSALRHGVAAILPGESLDLRLREGAMAAPFNASRGVVATRATLNHRGLVERRTEEGVEFGEHFGSWTFDGVRRFSGSGPGVATCASSLPIMLEKL